MKKAIIVDLDGTLADNTHRSPFDYGRVSGDTLIDVVADHVRLQAAQGTDIVVVSGRDDSCHADSLAWLNKHGIFPAALFMRATGDNRQDALVKTEIYNQNIAPNWDVLFVLDDRNQVVRAWRDLGLTCFQVADGDF